MGSRPARRRAERRLQRARARNARAYRRALLPGRVHALYAEPEALKTWLALKAIAEGLSVGETVLFIDFEDSAQAIVARLLDLGVSGEAIAAGLTYIRPDEPLAGAAIDDLDAALRAEPRLAVLDGLTEALSHQGLNPLDNSDVAAWLDLLPRRLVRTGAAVLLLDHVVKDREQRGRYAIGAQHKLAGVDVAYSLRVIEPFAPGRDGLVAVRVEKDRPGRVRQFAQAAEVATLRATSQDDSRVRIKLEPPEASVADGGEFRPTRLMEKVSRFVEGEPGATRNAVRRGVVGKGEWVDRALAVLTAELFIEQRREGQANRHYSTTPYREDTDRVPESQPSPNRVPDPAGATESPGPAPLRGDPDPGPGATQPNGHQPSPNTHPPKCCCKDGGAEPTPDGRCS